MKAHLFGALLAATLISGCVLPSPPPLVTVQSAPAPVVYRPGYVVDTLPAGYRTVTVRRNTYYVDRDVYYRPYGRRYVVVRRPY